MSTDKRVWDQTDAADGEGETARTAVNEGLTDTGRLALAVGRIGLVPYSLISRHNQFSFSRPEIAGR